MTITQEQKTGGSATGKKGAKPAGKGFHERSLASGISIGQTLELFKSYGIPVAGTLVKSEAELESALRETGAESYALKAATHEKGKKGKGMVRLDVSAQEALEAYRELAALSPEGVLVQPMHKGSELFIGGGNSEYGPFVIVKEGGARADVYKECITLTGSFTMEEAGKKLENFKPFKLYPKESKGEIAKIMARLRSLLDANPWIKEADLNPVMVDGASCKAVDVRIAPQEEERKKARILPPETVKERLDALFNPKNIVVLGASIDPKNRERAMLTANLLSHIEAMTFVNPNGGEIFGKKALKSIGEMKKAPEAAIIFMNAENTVAALEECARYGVKTALLLGAGFNELDGERGSELTARLRGIIEENGMTVIGPNGVGVLNSRNGFKGLFALDAGSLKLIGVDLKLDECTFPKKAGGISLVSQSGGHGVYTLYHMGEMEIPFGVFVSAGNAAGITMTELLKYFAEDEKTKVIAMYVEGLPDGREFMEAAREISRKKPIVVMKGGLAGSAATLTHTGSAAGSYELFKAAAEASGIVIVDDMKELLLASRILERGVPKARGVGIITQAGGARVQLADEMHRHGVALAELSPETVEEIRRNTAPYMPLTTNPHDTGPDMSGFEPILKAVKNDSAVGLTITAVATIKEAADITSRTDPDTVFYIPFNPGKKAQKMFEERGIITSEDAGMIAKVVGRVFAYSEWLENR